MPEKNRNRNRNRSRKSDWLLLIIATFLVGMVVGAYMMPRNAIEAPQTFIYLQEGKEVIVGIPAVDANGNGVLGKLITEVRPGNGDVLVNIKNVIALGDTQQSAANAVAAAADYTNMNLSRVDIIFNIEVNATEIEGPSAGSSMAVAVVFGLLNQTPRSDVVMTGTIDENGNIGKVGGILEKGQAAKDAGATVFVVPAGQSTGKETIRARQCRQTGRTQICKIIYQTQSVNVGQKLNMTVVEVSSLKDAVKYFEK